MHEGLWSDLFFCFFDTEDEVVTEQLFKCQKKQHSQKIFAMKPFFLIPYAPTPQNGDTHSSNLPTNCLSVFDHFVGLARKGLNLKEFTINQFENISSGINFDCK